MPYKLTVDHPDFPKGWQFDCDGIPVENGGSTTLTKEQEIEFIGKWGHDVKHFYGHGTLAKVSGSSELTSKEKAAVLPTETVESDDSKDGGE